MYQRLAENSGKGMDNVVLTPHVISLLWNQCLGTVSISLSPLRRALIGSKTGAWKIKFSFLISEPQIFEVEGLMMTFAIP